MRTERVRSHGLAADLLQLAREARRVKRLATQHHTGFRDGDGRVAEGAEDRADLPAMRRVLDRRECGKHLTLLLPLQTIARSGPCTCHDGAWR